MRPSGSWIGGKTRRSKAGKRLGDFAAESLHGKAVQCAHASRSANALAGFVVIDERQDSNGKPFGVAGRIADRADAVFEQFDGPSRRCDDDGLSDAHRFRDGQTERLRPGARVHDDVQASIDVARVALKWKKPD